MNSKWMQSAIEKGRERLNASHASGALTSEELIERNNYMNLLDGEYKEAIRVVEPRVFLSYTRRREDLGRKAYTAVRKAQSLALNLGKQFHVEDGFRLKGEAEVREQVLLYLNSCCLFLGVMTADLRLDETQVSDGNAAPAGWVVIEAGMAEALDIPVVLLVERGVHPDFWLKPFKRWRHIEFDARDFTNKLDEAVGRLREQYRMLTTPR